MIDDKFITVTDFKFDGQTKLFDVTCNKVTELPLHLQLFGGHRKQFYRGLMYASYDEAVSLSSTEQALKFHYDRFRKVVEIINHDCIDFVFYNHKQ